MGISIETAKEKGESVPPPHPHPERLPYGKPQRQFRTNPIVQRAVYGGHRCCEPNAVIQAGPWLHDGRQDKRSLLLDT